MKKPTKQQSAIDTIRAALDGLGLRYEEQAEDGRIVFGLRTPMYRNPMNQSVMGIVISVMENGEFLRLESRCAYAVPPDHPNLSPFLQAMAAMNFLWKLLCYGWNPDNGEVKASIDLAIEDGALTQMQFRRALDCLVTGLNQNHPTLARALRKGVFEQEQPPDRMLDMFRKLGEMLEEFGAKLSGDVDPAEDSSEDTGSDDDESGVAPARDTVAETETRSRFDPAILAGILDD